MSSAAAAAGVRAAVAAAAGVAAAAAAIAAPAEQQDDDEQDDEPGRVVAGIAEHNDFLSPRLKTDRGRLGRGVEAARRYPNYTMTKSVYALQAKEYANGAE